MFRSRGTALRARTLLAAALLATCALVTPAAAQPDDESLLGPSEPPGDVEPPDVEPPPGDEPGEPAIDPETAKVMARKLLQGGDEFFKKGDYYVKRKKPKDAAERYERALAAYHKAYELVPNPQILFPIAQAEDKLGRWVDAATHYRRFLADATDADAALHTKAAARLEAIKLELGVVTLAVQPDGAAVELDGKPVGVAPLAEPLFLAPGEYTLTLTAEGYQPGEQKLSVEAGSEAERTFELEPVPAVIVDAAPPPPPPPPPPKPAPGPSKLPLVLGGGVTLGLVGGAVATGLMATSRHDVWVDEGASLERRETARDEGRRLALITDGLIAGGVIAAGVTTYYYLKVYRPKRRAWEARNRERLGRAAGGEDVAWRPYEPPPAPKVLVLPWVEGSGPTAAAGLGLRGAL